MAQTHGNTAGSKLINAPHSRSFSGPFGRMFRILPAWEPEGKTTEAEILDEIARIADEMKSSGGPPAENDRIPAGYTYFGQFVDHDLTFDPRSSLQKQNDPESLEDFRSPAFDLDCLYGRGPSDQPYMYGQSGDPEFAEGMLRYEKKNIFGVEDLLRVGPAIQGPAKFDGLTDPKDRVILAHRAVIGDKRNDENTFVSQLQLAFIKFHNAVFENLTEASDPSRFKTAQRITRWYYQWVVVHDWLTLLCGEEVVNKILDGGDAPDKPKLRYYNYHEYPFMPVEFSVAAYRLGHSMVRGRYRLNDTIPFAPATSLPLFEDSPDANNSLIKDFRGFHHMPPLWTIDWSHFLKFTHLSAQPNLQFSLLLDKSLAGALIAMPTAVADPDEVPANPLPPSNPPPPPQNPIKRSLAYRNLLRSWRMGLPSGEAVARLMGIEKVNQKTPGKTLMDPNGNTPLWRYILDEAALDGDGKQLGPVGATIVAETFIGLLAADPSSFLRMQPKWQPDLGPKFPDFPKGKDFKLPDIIKFAGGRIGS